MKQIFALTLAFAAACGAPPAETTPDAAPTHEPVDAAAPRCTGFFGPPIQQTNLSTDGWSGNARLSGDQLMMVFGSERTGGGAGANNLWRSERASATGAWSSPQPMGNDCDCNESAVWMSADTLSLIEVHWEPSSRTPYAPTLAVTTRSDTSSNFAAPSPLANFDDPEQPAGEPWLGGTTGTLWYTGYGSDNTFQLYSATRESPSAWSPGVALPRLTAGQNLDNAVLSGDELTLYFSSYERDSSGTHDVIYRATRASTEVPFATAAPVTELGMGGANEEPSWLSPDGCTLYFGAGNDIYIATRAE